MNDALTSLKVTILGSGTSTGVPIIACKCAVCLNDDPRNKRTRASVLVEPLGLDAQKIAAPLVIDTTPEFRLQMLNAKVEDLSCVLYTHMHADHIYGFDDLRAFYFKSGRPVATYVHRIYEREFKQRFSYAFEDTGYLGQKPQIDLRIFDEGFFQIPGLEVESVLLEHGSVRTAAFKIGTFLYATDFKRFPQDVVERWRGKIDTMVASGLHFGEHATHSVIPETVALMDALEVKKGVITHLTHEVDARHDQARIGPGRFLAYDGMQIDVILR